MEVIVTLSKMIATGMAVMIRMRGSSVAAVPADVAPFPPSYPHRFFEAREENGCMDYDEAVFIEHDVSVVPQSAMLDGLTVRRES